MGRAEAKEEENTRGTTRHTHKAPTQKKTNGAGHQPSPVQQAPANEYRHRITVEGRRPMNWSAAGHMANDNFPCRGVAPVTWE